MLTIPARQRDRLALSFNKTMPPAQEAPLHTGPLPAGYSHHTPPLHRAPRTPPPHPLSAVCTSYGPALHYKI